MPDPSTPLMRQYSSIKQEHPSALLFFRLGDFYEMFFEDAVLAAKELQITLTSRNKEKGIAIPMCGVPYHAAEGYIAKLIRRGYKVAICEQMEDPRLAKKLVRREVTRVVTPGTAADSTLGSEENNFLAAVVSIEAPSAGHGNGHERPAPRESTPTSSPQMLNLRATGNTASPASEVRCCRSTLLSSQRLRARHL